MAEGGGAGEKTEKPTAKKKGELRKKGVVPRSQELPQSISLFVLVVALPIALSNLYGTYSGLMASALTQAGTADLGTAATIGRTMLMAGAKAMAVPVLLVMGSIILTNVAITREKPNLKLIKPRFESLSPKAGIKKVVSAHGLVEFVKTTVKLTLMIGLGYLAYRRGITHLVNSPASMEAVVTTTLASAKTLLVQVAVLALVIGFVDVAWALRKFGKQSKMSKQEVKEEAKQQDVNPEVKNAIRGRQLKMSRSRMMSAVAEADVVLVNPTHFAVALKYEAGSFAPQVVAKGAGVIAQRIREKAEEAGVPVVRNVPLCRALHSGCQLGDSIPIELFRAVAEVLATVFATKRKRGGSFPQVKPVTDPADRSDVPDPRSSASASASARSSA